MKVSNKLPNAMQNAEAAKANKSVGADSLLNGAKNKNVGSRNAEIGASARVDLSERAQDIKKAKELATPDGGVDEAKVARLQKLIDEGKYKINAEAIADRLLDEQMKMST